MVVQFPSNPCWVFFSEEIIVVCITAAEKKGLEESRESNLHSFLENVHGLFFTV